METMEKLTIRCFVLGMAFVLVWFICCTTGNWMYRFHSMWFKELAEYDFAVINYTGLMFAKVFIWLFFLIPYIACKWARSK